MILYMNGTQIVMSTPGDKIPNEKIFEYMPVRPEYTSVVVVDDIEDSLYAAANYEAVEGEKEVILVEKHGKKELKLKKR